MKVLLGLLVFSTSCFCIWGSQPRGSKGEELVQQDTSLIKECLNNKYTHDSCKKVFCHPWQRCVGGSCICKLPYQCPKNITAVCSTNGKTFQNYCQLKTYECQHPQEKFQSKTKCGPSEKFDVSLAYGESQSEGFIQVKLVNHTEKLFICNNEWSMNEANVVCRHLGFKIGAEYAKNKPQVPEPILTSAQCLHATCRGLETSLAECTLTETPHINGNNGFASVVCHKESKECSPNQFHCVNEKCIPLNETCNGINDCGDLSDELCCKECKGNSFHCNSDVCIPNTYLCNREVDCLAGEDESQAHCGGDQKPKSEVSGVPKPKGTEHSHSNADIQGQQQEISTSSTDGEQHVFVPISNMDEERKTLKTLLPQLMCGITSHPVTRRKRIIGGNTARKGEFPWQVAIREGTGTVNCGGIYIGGCWILTAAHCVRKSRVNQYRIWTGILDTILYNQEIDTFRLNQVIIHENYNASNYVNDIALLEMKSNEKGKPCSLAYSIPACVPWSEYLFRPGQRCKVSGWGLADGFTKQFVLRWGNIHLFPNCSDIYKERFFNEMECAGTFDGSIDSCKGDSGGPLVCLDSNNRAYVWGIVSWGENCGVQGYPGVYTKVAKYFDWISRHVGRSLISLHNV